MDLPKLLGLLDKPYLKVVSKPSPTATVGKTFRYQIQTYTNEKKITYKLESAPKGMHLSSEGIVQWPVETTGSRVAVIISVRSESGAEVLHSFNLSTARKAGAGLVKAATGPDGKAMPAKLVKAELDAQQMADLITAVKLPGTARTIRVGANGQILIFHLPKENKLVAVDVKAKKIVKEFEVAADVKFAANRKHLIIILPSQKMIQRWSLATLQREAIAPFSKPVDIALMGSNSEGPLGLRVDQKLQLWDVQSLKPIRSQDRLIGGNGYSVSADGQTFCGWNNGVSGQRYAVMRLLPKGVMIKQSPDAFSVAGHWAMPNADGSLTIRHGGGVYGHDMKPLPAITGNILLPANDRRFLVGCKARNKNASDVTIFAASGLQPLLTINNVATVNIGLSTEQGRLHHHPRIYYLPDLQRLVTVPGSNNTVEIHELDLPKILRSLEVPYLKVVSKPEPTATVGKTYQYQLQAYTNENKVSYKLESAPAGMQLSSDGLIEWPVKTRPIGGQVAVIVGIRGEQGTEVLHSFNVSVIRDHSADLATSPNGKPAASVIKVDDFRLEFPGPSWVKPGTDGKLLVLHGDDLTVLGPDGFSVVKTAKLDKKYLGIRERKDYYVAIADEPRGVFVISKQDHKVLRSITLSNSGMVDLVLHPTKPWTYAAYRRVGELPRNKFIVFNELTGKGREGDDMIGGWLAVDPSGRFLVSGYRDIYQSGSRLIMNPKRWHVTPKYGNIDWLIRYDILTNGDVAVKQIKEKAGGNGRGLRMSRDGKTVSYLSIVGSPQFSGNLAGWTPTDFRQIPVTYATKDIGTPQEMAYHPTLPLVASPGSGSAVFFDRETGKKQENRLKVPEGALEGTSTHRIYFSPNGRHLLFNVTVNGIHYLIKTDLRLTAEESRTAATFLRPTSPLSGVPSGPERTKNKTTDLARFTSLAGGAGKEMKPKEIAQSFLESVLVVQRGDSTGTGFSIGSGGLVLTCAHCVDGDGRIQVTYRKQGKRSNGSATVIAVDQANDLALLQLSDRTGLPNVRFAIGHPVATGERVSVVGNPGVGNRVLEHTMTEGIVSNPRQVLSGQTFIQTSAPVNPGSSGGPMFNEKGLVIGMVVRKARIENAGFAIPSSIIATFLMQNINREAGSLAIRRDWTNAGGTRQLSAVFAGFGDDKVLLRGKNGANYQIPLGDLSKADQFFLRMLQDRLK